MPFLAVSVCPYYFFSKNTNWIELTFYMDLSYVKTQKSKQDGDIDVHNFAKISIIMHNLCFLQFGSVHTTFSQKLLVRSNWHFTWTFLVLRHTELSKMGSWTCVLLQFFQFFSKLLKGFCWNFSHVLLIIACSRLNKNGSAAYIVLLKLPLLCIICTFLQFSVHP